MNIAAADFAALHAATRGIPLALALVWSCFLAVPLAVVGGGFLARVYARLFPTPAAPSYVVRVAKNGRLYACVPGTFGVVWARRGESAADLLARVSSL